MEVGMQKWEVIEVGSRTRRRPKRMGFCRGNDAGGGNRAAGTGGLSPAV
jgi:hypothetical protein